MNLCDPTLTMLDPLASYVKATSGEGSLEFVEPETTPVLTRRMSLAALNRRLLHRQPPCAKSGHKGRSGSAGVLARSSKRKSAAKGISSTVRVKRPSHYSTTSAVASSRKNVQPQCMKRPLAPQTGRSHTGFLPFDKAHAKTEQATLLLFLLMRAG